MENAINNPLYATEPSAAVSGRYQFISTADILSTLHAAGWSIYRTQVARTRSGSRIGKQKHVVTLRHPDYSLRTVGDLIPQIIIINSHDGSSSVQVMAGIFRLACSNGLVVGQTCIQTGRIAHVGADLPNRVAAAVGRVVQQLDLVLESVRKMKETILTPERKTELALQAMQVRYPDAEKRPPVDTRELLRVTRLEDAGDDLWTVFNRVQEKLVGGGMSYATRRGNGLASWRRTREVRGPIPLVQLNSALWDLASSYVEVA